MRHRLKPGLTAAVVVVVVAAAAAIGVGVLVSVLVAVVASAACGDGVLSGSCVDCWGVCPLGSDHMTGTMGEPAASGNGDGGGKGGDSGWSARVSSCCSPKMSWSFTSPENVLGKRSCCGLLSGKSDDGRRSGSWSPKRPPPSVSLLSMSRAACFRAQAGSRLSESAIKKSTKDNFAQVSVQFWGKQRRLCGQHHFLAIARSGLWWKRSPKNGCVAPRVCVAAVERGCVVGQRARRCHAENPAKAKKSGGVTVAAAVVACARKTSANNGNATSAAAQGKARGDGGSGGRAQRGAAPAQEQQGPQLPELVGVRLGLCGKGRELAPGRAPRARRRNKAHATVFVLSTSTTANIATTTDSNSK